MALRVTVNLARDLFCFLAVLPLGSCECAVSRCFGRWRGAGEPGFLPPPGHWASVTGRRAPARLSSAASICAPAARFRAGLPSLRPHTCSQLFVSLLSPLLSPDPCPSQSASLDLRAPSV